MSFQNIHLIDLQTSPMPASGGMARPPVSQYYDIPNANCYSGAGFAWPLGTYLSGGTPLAQYYFNRNGTYNLLPKVIEFDPQGSARIITTQPSSTSALLDAIPQYIEIGLEPSHGAVAAAAPADQVHNPGQIAAIQIDGMSGAIRTYRP
jgi:hypothetical protein